MTAVILVLNNFTHDSRVLRQAETLAKCGYQVYIFAIHAGELPLSYCCADYRLYRFKLTTKRLPRTKPIQVVKYIECLLRMLWTALRLNPNLVHANDVDCLPIGLALKYLCRAQLIYDAHELWFDAAYDRPYPRWVSWLIERVEKAMAKKADRVVTVCDSIAEHMSVTLNIRVPHVIRNIPACNSNQDTDKSELHRLISLNSDVPVILNLGMISPGRGLETLLTAMRSVRSPAVAVLLGTLENGGNSGFTFLDALKAQANALGIRHRVRFVPAVPPHDLHRYARGATIGVAPIEATCLSYRYCLPNKLFEYIQAGLPVVTSDLPEMARLVTQYQIGEVFRAGDADGLACSLNSILESPRKLRFYRQQAVQAAHDLSWDREQPKLIAIYDELRAS